MINGLFLIPAYSAESIDFLFLIRHLFALFTRGFKLCGLTSAWRSSKNALDRLDKAARKAQCDQMLIKHIAQLLIQVDQTCSHISFLLDH